jgi:F-type H+-transporting ATPase subunit epsilon
MPLVLEIVTPDARVYSETIETVVLPTTTGEVGILPGHIPLLTEIEEGELRVTKDGVTHNLAVGRGFAEVSGDKVAVLTESAIEAEKIDVAAVEEALRKAKERLASTEKISPEELDRLETLTRFANAQLLVKRRKGS